MTDKINELSLKYYPKPFKNRITIDFILKESSTVLRDSKKRDIVNNRILLAINIRFEGNSKSIPGTYFVFLQ